MSQAKVIIRHFSICLHLVFSVLLLFFKILSVLLTRWFLGRWIQSKRKCWVRQGELAVGKILGFPTLVTKIRLNNFFCFQRVCANDRFVVAKLWRRYRMVHQSHCCQPEWARLLQQQMCVLHGIEKIRLGIERCGRLCSHQAHLGKGILPQGACSCAVAQVRWSSCYFASRKQDWSQQWRHFQPFEGGWGARQRGRGQET